MAETTIHTAAGSPAIRLALRIAAVATAAMALAGCYQPREMAEPIPNDYRARHPISIVEGERSMAVFVGTQRGGLSPVQRADVLAFSQAWRKEATGSVVVEVPVQVPAERAAADTAREIVSMLKAVEIPSAAIRVRQYRPDNAARTAVIRINYSRIEATAGPCGLWPKDLGPAADPTWEENRPYWNFGCASQRNLAAMVDNPADIVQPRPEAPAYAPRRSQVLEKYRTGQSAATVSTTPNKGRITDVGQ